MKREMTKRKRTKGKLIRCVSLLLVLVLVLGLKLPSAATSLGDINDAKKQLEKIEEAKKKAQARIKELEKLQDDLNAYIKALDGDLAKITQKLDKIDADIAATQANIDTTSAEIETASSDLAAAQATEDKQYEDMKKRIQFMYEKGDTQYLELIFSADSFADALNRIEYISQISSYDRKKLEEYAATKEAIAELKASLEEHKVTLESEKNELEGLKADAEAEKASLEALSAAKAKLVAKYEEEESQMEKEVADMEEEIGAQKERIKEMEAAYNAANKVTLGSLKFSWPLAVKGTITSEFGTRRDPVTGVEGAFHSGTDIAAPYGTAIRAAESGIVTMVGYTSINGNYVKVYHGDGVTTAYLHMSKTEAVIGQEVQKGDIIGRVGSTGKSTGNHLHIALNINGKYVDPLPYIR